MKLLITGSKGQLGAELVRQAISHDVIAVGYDQLDITDTAAVSSFARDIRPDAVINAAAYTAVDKAENESSVAFAVNHDGPENLAVACHSIGIPLIHVSTDYVFDGCKKAPYAETDPVAPLGVYGASKWAGEEVVREHCPRHIILRTSWVFSAHGRNFVRTMLHLGAERETLRIVADQVGKPTSASELARTILEILPASDGCWGTYHLAQPDATSWHDFAKAVFAEAVRQGLHLRIKQVRPITTADYPTSAKRPANSALNCDRMEAVFGVKIKPWRESLEEVIHEIKSGDLRGK